MARINKRLIRRRRRRSKLLLRYGKILAWADAHHHRTGAWPTHESGEVHAAPGEIWGNIDSALRKGGRGLPGGSSVARLLAEHRDKRHPLYPPSLTIKQVLAWADAHKQRTTDWPDIESGPIAGARGETWRTVARALRDGRRGLPGRLSLADMLLQYRGVRHHAKLPRYTKRQIRMWAKRHHQQTGRWPNLHAGPISDAPGETWHAVESALSHGKRGLPGGSSLAKFLQQQLGVRNRMDVPRLRQGEMLRWADLHQRRTGRWPRALSGPIRDAPGETWCAVDNRLIKGGRGLPGGSSLARFLARHRNAPHRFDRPPFSIDGVLAWADKHFQRTGAWPRQLSGPVHDAPKESWKQVDVALCMGQRGLPPGPTLAALLAERRGVRDRLHPPRLNVKQILAWADSHHARTGVWPKQHFGPVVDAPGETWMAINLALRRGTRGLPRGSPLASLLERRRGVPPQPSRRIG